MDCPRSAELRVPPKLVYRCCRLAVAERVLERVSEQLAQDRAETAPVLGRVGGQAMMMIPHRAAGMEETVLSPDYQRILAAVRKAAGPVMGRQVGEMVGVDVSLRARLEPLRGKLIRMVDRGWLRKRPTAGSPPACDRGHPGDAAPHRCGRRNRGAPGLRRALREESQRARQGHLPACLPVPSVAVHAHRQRSCPSSWCSRSRSLGSASEPSGTCRCGPPGDRRWSRLGEPQQRLWRGQFEPRPGDSATLIGYTTSRDTIPSTTSPTCCAAT